MKRFRQFVLVLVFLVGLGQVWMVATHMQQTPKPRVLILISTPRSVTTAFERSFMERGDFTVVHEPWSTLEWYRRYGKDGFDGAVPDMATKAQTFDEILAMIDEMSEGKQVFIKDFAYSTAKGLKGRADWVADPDVEITFLIRHPANVLRSYQKMMPNFPRDTVDYQELWDLVQWVEHVKGKAPVIVETDRLLDDPAGTLEAYCQQVNIPFVAEALTWSIGMPSEWECYRSWHLDAANCSGFKPRNKEPEAENILSENLPRGELQALMDHNMPYYNKLRKRAI